MRRVGPPLGGNRYVPALIGVLEDSPCHPEPPFVGESRRRICRAPWKRVKSPRSLPPPRPGYVGPCSAESRLIGATVGQKILIGWRLCVGRGILGERSLR